jgi:hypothetical protein
MSKASATTAGAERVAIRAATKVRMAVLSMIGEPKESLEHIQQ